MGVLFVCLTIAADPAAAKPAEEPRPFHEMAAEISDLLKREAQLKDKTAKDKLARAQIVERMCRLHGEILADARYETSDTLKEYRGRLWSRLRRVQSDLKKQLARVPAKGAEEAAADDALLANADPAALAAADSLSASLALLDASQGGPGSLLAFGGRAGPADYGPDLVDLIERTINPAFWDTNGGPGSIVYYAPLKCLVVRATGEVHGKIGGVLGGLRDAGR
jgi:hypothetical protein